jgi:hypothetical protein
LVQYGFFFTPLHNRDRNRSGSEARINRHDFQVSWNGQLEKGGEIVGDEVVTRVDVEALPEADMQRIMKK